MKLYFSVVAVLMVLLGAGWLFFPEAMLASWNAGSDAAGVYMARRYGSLLLGYAAILWLARSAGASSARAAILGGGAFVTGLVTLVSLLGVLKGTIGPAAWAAVAIEGVLTGGFVYYFFTEKVRLAAEPRSPTR